MDAKSHIVDAYKEAAVKALESMRKTKAEGAPDNGKVCVCVYRMCAGMVGFRVTGALAGLKPGLGP